MAKMMTLAEIEDAAKNQPETVAGAFMSSSVNRAISAASTEEIYMGDPEHVVSNADLSMMDDLRNLLADFETPEPDEDEVEAVEDIAEEDLENIEADLERDAIYAEAESEGEVIDDMTAEPEKPAKRERKARAVSERAKSSKGEKAKTPKVERDLSALPAEAFVRFADETPSDSVKELVIATRPAQKKIAEKFDQTIAAIHAGRLPSVYVIECFKALSEKGEVTTADLTARMTGPMGLNPSTASSQVGQIMVLFPVLGIANRDGNKLTRREDSVFAAKLNTLLV